MKKILTSEEVKYSIKAVADYLLAIVKGEQALPYQEKEVVFNLYGTHLTVTVKNELISEVWVGQLFFVSKDEDAFTELVQEFENFLKTRGKPIPTVLRGRDVKLHD